MVLLFTINTKKYLFLFAHKSKNLSDTIGSLTKQAFTSGSKTKDVGITNIDDIIKLIMENINTATKKFDNFLIVKMDPLKKMQIGWQSLLKE